MPSPVKLQPKVSYCKTYEEIRLEEIQAESAAYYSYEGNSTENAGSCRNEADVGKAKRINASCGREWICVNPSMETPKGAAKELNFKVLSLEEIRQRKREKELAVTAKTAMTDASKAPVSTASVVSSATKATKRRSGELCDEKSNIAAKRFRRTSSEFTKATESSIKVTPVKLRRTLKGVAAKKLEMQLCESAPMDEEEGGTTGGEQSYEMAYGEGVEDYGDKPVNVNRRSEVEVRMCDSSTMEQKTQTQPERPTEDKKSVATYATTEDIINSALLDIIQPFSSTEEEYLRLDASSDEIMKDIEDLLK